MKQSESIAKLAAALVKANGELRGIAKDATNPHFKSKFASLGAIIEDVRPILARHGLAIVQGATLPESDANAKVTGFSVETMLVHESGEWVCSSLPMPLAKQDPQGAGAAMTYGRRYGLSALLSLNTDEDDDGNGASSTKRSGSKAQGGASSGATAGTTQPPATTQAPVLNRESVVPFAPKLDGGAHPAIGELPYKFLQWVLEAPEKRIPEPHRDVWTKALRDEIDGRQAGDFTQRDVKATAGV